MPLVQSVDYPNKRIYLSADTLGLSVQPVDVYKEVRELRQTTADHRKFLPLISARGNEQAGPTNTPVLTILANGARIVPFDVTHTLTIGGTIVSIAENLAGPDLFDRAPLSPATQVDVSYQPPQVEVIEVEAPTAATDIADAVWQRVIEDTLTGENIMRLLLAATTGAGGPNGSRFEYSSADGTKVRVGADVTAQGVRSNVTRDGS